MAKVELDWENGAKLDLHTERKHKILREYLREYLITRCKFPQQEKFRLAIVDGFAGAGRYLCGSPGSPVIILEVLRDTLQEINLTRVANNMRPIAIECFLILNELDATAYYQLTNNIAGYVAASKEPGSQLFLEVETHQRAFADMYTEVKSKIQSGRYKNVLFNLDQYGYSDAPTELIRNIMISWKSVEVFLTFSIGTIRAFLSHEREKNRTLPQEQEILDQIYRALHDGEQAISKQEWLGVSEKIVFENLRAIAPFVSPFSVHNPDGWRYWLVHFANAPRARQVYNDVLHENSSQQAHVGRAGLNMLAYNPETEGKLYLFGKDSRSDARRELHVDIPERLSEFGDAATVEEFNREIYNETAAHSEDILTVISENEEIEVLTPLGNERQKSHTIRPDDVIRLKMQPSFFPMFARKNKS